MTKPSAEAREPLSSQIDRLANFIIEHVPGEPSRSEGAVDTAIRLLGALPEKDAALAEAQEETRMARIERDGANEYLGEARRRLTAFEEWDHAPDDCLDPRHASLEADLAAMRGALDLWDSATNHDVTRLSPSGLCAKESGRKMLASSPGATWLATAREVVEILASGLAAPSGQPICACRNREASKAGIETPCWYCAARALLASPEVQAWRK